MPAGKCRDLIDTMSRTPMNGEKLEEYMNYNAKRVAVRLPFVDEQRKWLLKIPGKDWQRSHISDRQGRFVSRVYFLMEEIAPRTEIIIGTFRTIKELDEMREPHHKVVLLFLKDMKPLYFEAKRRANIEDVDFWGVNSHES
jgi:hypothetical protein